MVISINGSFLWWHWRPSEDTAVLIVSLRRCFAFYVKANRDALIQPYNLWSNSIWPLSYSLGLSTLHPNPFVFHRPVQFSEEMTVLSRWQRNFVHLISPHRTVTRQYGMLDERYDAFYLQYSRGTLHPNWPMLDIQRRPIGLYHLNVLRFRHKPNNEYPVDH